MERGMTPSDGDASRGAQGFALSSRAAALAECRAGLEAGTGPVLVTGEAGVGKTWLVQALADGAGDLHWVAVDLTPATSPADLFRAIGQALGLPMPDSLGAARLTLAEDLAERAADGHRWVLVVDEAHAAPAVVLEELRVLSNRLGRPDGFAGLVLVGQTPLIRRLASRPLVALESRLAARVHLRPLDLDEARELLCRLRPGRVPFGLELDELHRRVGGNPRLLLRQVARVSLASPPPSLRRPAAIAPRFSDPVPAPESEPIPESEPAPESKPAPVVAHIDPTPIVPQRPPLRVEEGLIEVGWEPEPESELEPEPEFEPITVPEPELAPVASARSESPEPSEPSEQAVQDHYAALQAWNEWARNQGRSPELPSFDPEAATPADFDSTDSPEGLPGLPNVWVDGQQGFAPYSQLFSRLKQVSDSE